ncbi:MAG: phosphopantothenoylcysteine decarboxylase [Planctomycetota bacterium]|nr:phosphopantothenoylcysteine decarboxylase [Planctomycetota bacterium]
MRLLITAGPTREYLDPVRYLSNASSGRMGCALAAAAKAAGHEVALILGPVTAEPPEVDELVRVTSAADMFEAVLARFDGCDVFISAAAVCDYRPICREERKIKKTEGHITLELERTADILLAMSKRRRRQILVGFCLETEDLERRARDKLQVKQLDLVVANGPEAIDADRQDALLITSRGECERLDGVTKKELADRILAAVTKRGR